MIFQIPGRTFPVDALYAATPLILIPLFTSKYTAPNL